MDLAAEMSYQTPLSGVKLLPMLLVSMLTQRNSPNTAKNVRKEYDYVVVGAGSAGSVVASRLSEIPCVSVLLLEAGKPPPLLTDVPSIARAFWLTDINWGYRTAPQKYTARLMNNRQMVIPLGKTLGGTSVLNDMIYARGNRKNYDSWAADGAEGWSYKDVLPYFLKMEDNRDPEYVANGFHNVSGPLTVMRPRYNSEIKDPIFQAARKLGYKIVDSNAARETGFYDQQATIRDGRRCSTAKAYLVPADNRTNFDILPNAMVRKILIKNRRAVGVQFDYQDSTYEVKAKREVIVSAGSIHTPKLLMLSGIGPKKELERFKIPCVADLPVGENLQDHCASLATFTVSPTISNYLVKLINPVNVAEYILKKTGPLASNELIAATAFLRSGAANPRIDFPNFALIFAEALSDVAPVINLRYDAYLQMFAPYEGRALYACAAYLLEPRSRGTVKLQSTDPYDPPLVDPNFFENPRDMQSVVDGLKVCLHIGNSTEMRQRVESRPLETLIPGCEKFAKNLDRYLWCQVKALAISAFHQVGTARMGNAKDPRTVVDPQLRVKNIRGLRVVDASVMPTIPSGNTNIPTIMVAEKASDMIKATIHCHRDTQKGDRAQTKGSNYIITCHKRTQKEDLDEMGDSNHNIQFHKGSQDGDCAKKEKNGWPELQDFQTLFGTELYDFQNKSEKDLLDFYLP